MAETENFFFLNSHKNAVEDECKLGLVKGSFGGVTRKGLVDISNLSHRPKPFTQDKKSQLIPSTTREYIDQLKKENMALVKLLAERNKIIELSGIEIQNLRINLQKIRQQNLQLAQSNSQMLAELNSDKDRLKTLHHELGCKNGLLKAQKLEHEEKARTTICQKLDNQPKERLVKSAVLGESKRTQDDDNKPCSSNRRQRSMSSGPSIVQQVKKEKADNKRSCVRRQSARFKSEEPKPTEVLFGIDEAKFSLCPPHDDPMQENISSLVDLSVKGEEFNPDPRYEAQVFPPRSSFGRPLRQAATKVQSYKEAPLNVKMRRTE